MRGLILGIVLLSLLTKNLATAANQTRLPAALTKNLPAKTRLPAALTESKDVQTFTWSTLASPAGSERIRTITDRDRLYRNQWQINPAVKSDPFFHDYPNPDTIPVANARLLANMVKEQFNISGDRVYREGSYVGQLALVYTAFPKCGSSSMYEFLKNNPCVARPVIKEQNWWSHHPHGFLPECTTSGKKLISCDPASIVERITVIAKRYLSAVAGTAKSGLCPTEPYIVDGTVDLFYLNTKMVKRNGKKDPIHFDYIQFFKELTPQAKFLASVRPNDVSSLRSHYWYFRRKSSHDDYRQAMEHTMDRLLPMKAAGSCAGLFRPGLTLDRPRVQGFPNSCSLQRIAHTFGRENLFITDGRAFSSCADHMLQTFFGLNVSCAVLLRTAPEVKNSHSSEYPSNFSADILALEDDMLALYNNITYPLLPPAPSS